ncbi:hypothetical protein L873DRAFT_1207028 [Choiromyces venosus 120613-1]|uniref:Uncharacterized protein n=1 Tax=Choiromyces venosus 120613-1 TaxID=1336337 RepID=A0A3N4JHB8_9PEZI|nr:hypothetical protein L873DRAFT_1207028 [Choiromyces venosus 120613-1]
MFKSVRTLRPLIPSISSPNQPITKSHLRPKSTYESTSDAKIPSKEDLNPTSKENTRTGTHDEVAHADNTAYNPDLTDPGSERLSAGIETKKPGNPLDASPANPEISFPEEDSRAEVGADKDRGRRGSGGG